MCKQKDLIPMNCDVFLAKGNSSRPENINIAGNLFISTDEPVKGKDVYVEGNLIGENIPITFNKIKVKGNLVNYGRCHFNFNSLTVEGSCIIGKNSEKNKCKKTPINCDVFCVSDHLPPDICITGNLYVTNNEAFPLPSEIDVGGDIYVDCARMRAYEIKSQGTVYVYGDEKRAFMFDFFAAMGGCKIYSDDEEIQ